MMVQTLIPNCSPASKTEEILSRYRPIAPKPELPPSSTTDGGGAAEEASQKMRHSPYLRNIWAHLQARPTRTRKRGRSSITPTLKRHHPHHRAPTPPFLGGLCCPSPLGFKQNMITLPLLSSPSSSSPSPTTPAEIISSCMDLDSGCGLEEKDLVLQLKLSPTIPWSGGAHVIAPKAVRPIGSTIMVGPISMEGSALREVAKTTRPEEVEVEAEAEAMPVLISDSKNRVRVANSAYKELVGQPECRWLDGLKGVTGRRISGEVTLQLPASVSVSELPGFSCWARIEWGKSSKKKGSSVDALCDVVRLNCETKDYLFSWRFHTKV